MNDDEWTAQELIDHLADCANQNFYFEIPGRDAKVLLDYIQELETALRVARGGVV